MNFTVAGSRIVCCRRDNTAGDEDVLKRVVEFDAQVEMVPPHVAARLTGAEIEELKGFILERKRIRSGSPEKNLIEALPDLLREATNIIESVETLNKAMYSKLSASVMNLKGALENVKPVSEHGLAPVKKMRISEAQKERLENIKQDL